MASDDDLTEKKWEWWDLYGWRDDVLKILLFCIVVAVIYFWFTSLEVYKAAAVHNCVSLCNYTSGKPPRQSFIDCVCEPATVTTYGGVGMATPAGWNPPNQ